MINHANHLSTISEWINPVQISWMISAFNKYIQPPYHKMEDQFRMESCQKNDDVKFISEILFKIFSSHFILLIKTRQHFSNFLYTEFRTK
ncbi:hypothetical protein ACH3XW_39640 [Acanthocheilonema viteae]